MRDNPMFGDDDKLDYLRPVLIADNQCWNTYSPSAAQWEVAQQMNADWVRLRNQEITITEMQEEAHRFREGLLSAWRICCIQSSGYARSVCMAVENALQETPQL